MVPPSAGVTQTVGDTDAISVGTVFQVTAGQVATHVRFYFGAGWDALGAPAAVAIYNNGTGVLLTSAVYAGTPSAGWNNVALPSGLALSASIGYIAVVYYPIGRYPAEGSYFDDHDPSNGPLALDVGGSNGKYGYATGISRPTSSFNFSSYFPDIIAADPSSHVTTEWASTYTTRARSTTAWATTYTAKHRATTAWASTYVTRRRATSAWATAYGVRAHASRAWTSSYVVAHHATAAWASRYAVASHIATVTGRRGTLDALEALPQGA